MTDDDPDIDAEAPPRRFKTIEELTVNEHLERQRGARPPETDAYRAYRRKVLERHGLEDAEERRTPTLEEMTPEDHARRKYGSA